MRIARQLFIGALALAFLFVSTGAHNITKILAKHPEFSTFNHYLTVTHLAVEINRRETITVCAVDNAAMSQILSKGYSVFTLRNILSLHVFADYFGSKKLHQITGRSTTTSSMFQASGDADGTSGFVNITDVKGGKVAFGTLDENGVYKLTSTFVKSVEEIPYNISVIQISHVLTSSEAEAPTAAPADINITSIMSEQGCKAFSDLLISSKAITIYNENLAGGLTVFCPSDAAVNAFMPKYKTLTAAEKQSLGLYHASPTYESPQMLKSNNGLLNTLATDGDNKFDFDVQNDGEDVTLKTNLVTATITSTVKDQEPLALYKIDKVLQPKELFTAEGDAHSPKKSKKGKAEAPSPESEDDSDAADQTANGTIGIGIGSGWWMKAVLGLSVVLSLSV